MNVRQDRESNGKQDRESIGEQERVDPGARNVGSESTKRKHVDKKRNSTKGGDISAQGETERSGAKTKRQRIEAIPEK